MPALELEFAVLGPIEVRRSGEPLPLGGMRMRQFLAYLLVRPNTHISADELLAAVWENTPVQNGANVLQACVSRLRSIIGSERLQTTTTGYRLTIAPGELDSQAFEQLVSEGQRALSADDPASAERALAQALALWQGRAFAEVTLNQALESERRRLEELRVAALESRTEAALQMGDGPELIAELSALAGLHPSHERLHAQLALALYRGGRQVDALDACRAAARCLRDELGLEPSRELRQLERSILRHDPALLGASFGRLPIPPTPLVGRAQECEQAQTLLRRNDVRMLTVTGPGGIGKSRVALEVARSMGEAIFVDLTRTTDATLVVPAIVTAAGARKLPGQSLASALESHLHDRDGLIVLDGFEHVIGASPSLAQLLAAIPGLKFLVTSRTVLRITAEHVFTIGALDEADAVRLFHLSARRVDPVHGADDAESVAQICRRLDGNPLAIELAAARTKLFTPRVMLERLESGFDLLTAGHRDAPERQQTLRATLDWSYALLDSEERRVLHGLSVFVGGFSLDAVRVVCAETGSLDRIASLVDKSLVQRESPMRFCLLDTVREYARERLAEKPVAESRARLRHAGYYAALAEEADSGLLSPGQTALLARLEREHGNIRAAFAFGLETRHIRLLFRLAVACRRFWHYRGHLAEGLEALSAVLALDGPEDELRAKALNGAGILAAELGDYVRARCWFDECADLAGKLGNTGLRADALGNIGRLALFEHDHHRAEMLVGRAVEPNAKGEYARAVSLDNLALIALSQRDFDRAFARARSARGLARRNGNPRMLAAATRTFGRVLLERGDLVEAAKALNESLKLEREAADPQGIADSTEALGELAAARGEGEVAATLFGTASAIRASLGAVRSPELREGYDRYSMLARESIGTERFDLTFAQAAEVPLQEALSTLTT